MPKATSKTKSKPVTSKSDKDKKFSSLGSKTTQSIADRRKAEKAIMDSM